MNSIERRTKVIVIMEFIEGNVNFTLAFPEELYNYTNSDLFTSWADLGGHSAASEEWLYAMKKYQVKDTAVAHQVLEEYCTQTDTMPYEYELVTGRINHRQYRNTRLDKIRKFLSQIS